MYAWAIQVLEAANALDQEVAQSRGALRGTLKVSTSHRLGAMHIAPILGQLRRQHPDLDVWLELVDRRVDLAGEAFDIDIRVGPVQEPHLVARKIAQSARILCAAPHYLEQRGHPATLAELAQHDCLLFRDRDRPFSTVRLQGPHGDESFHASGRLGSNQSDVVMRWARDGLGIALLSGWDVSSALRAGTLERVLPQYRQPADIYAVLSTRSSQSAKLQVCLDYLSGQLRTGPYALDLDWDNGQPQ